MVLAGLGVTHIPVEDFIASPRFELLSISEIGDGHIQMGFRYKMDEAEKYPFAFEPSHVVFNRNMNWCIVEADWHVEKGVQRVKQHLVRKLTPGPTSNGIPLVSQLMDTLDGKPFMKMEAEISTSPVDKSIFYLSHYGFPEPTFHRNYWPWIGGSLLLLILGVAGVAGQRLRQRL